MARTKEVVEKLNMLLDLYKNLHIMVGEEKEYTASIVNRVASGKKLDKEEIADIEDYVNDVADTLHSIMDTLEGIDHTLE